MSEGGLGHSVRSKGAPLRIAIERVRDVNGGSTEIGELVAFIEASERGMCRSAGPEVTTD